MSARDHRNVGRPRMSGASPPPRVPKTPPGALGGPPPRGSRKKRSRPSCSTPSGVTRSKAPGGVFGTRGGGRGSFHLREAGVGVGDLAFLDVAPVQEQAVAQ